MHEPPWLQDFKIQLERARGQYRDFDFRVSRRPSAEEHRSVLLAAREVDKAISGIEIRAEGEAFRIIVRGGILDENPPPFLESYPIALVNPCP